MFRLQEYDEVLSTNTLAKELLLAGTAHHGDVITARHQTGGRGRLGTRSWTDTAGESLLMSVVLEQLPIDRAVLLQYLAAVVVATTVREVLGESLAASVELSRVRIKWPNDVLVEGRKISGILSEGIWHGASLRGVILGIGVNVRQNFFRHDLEEVAHSLQLLGIDITVADFRDALLANLQHELERLETLPRHIAQMSIIGMLRTELGWMEGIPSYDVLLAAGSELFDMTYAGITDEGALVMKDPDGESVLIQAGSLSWPGRAEMKRLLGSANSSDAPYRARRTHAADV